MYSLGVELIVECVYFLLLSLIKIRRDLERKSVERDILVSLMEICLDLDKKFVECEDNFAF